MCLHLGRFEREYHLPPTPPLGTLYRLFSQDPLFDET